MTPNNERNKISITGILIQDPGQSGFTAYFAELPEVIVEGESKEEATRNLFDALKTVLSFRKTEMGDNAGDENIFTQSFDLEIS